MAWGGGEKCGGGGGRPGQRSPVDQTISRCEDAVATQDTGVLAFEFGYSFNSKIASLGKIQRCVGHIGHEDATTMTKAATRVDR